MMTNEPMTAERLASYIRQTVINLHADAEQFDKLPDKLKRKIERHIDALREMEARCKIAIGQRNPIECIPPGSNSDG
jgi:hypothetical protein